MNKHKRVWRWLAVIGLFLAICSSGCVNVVAQTVTQGYQSEQQLQKGMVVRLKPGDGTKVQAVTQADAQEMLGVVVSATEAAVSLSNTGVAQETFVVNGGQYDVLVSDQNGVIKTGDYISISSLAGVGMKASNRELYVLGKALNDFAGASATEGTATLKTDTGERKVNLGRIRVEISIAHNPLFQKEAPPAVPQFLFNLSQVVTDRPVSTFRIYASLLAAFITLIVAGIILFSGVRSGMIAVGRNPLAKKSIVRTLIQVTLMSLIIFLIGSIAVYLLLRA